MAQILLTSIGSSGDVFPFIGLGMALRKSGHSVTLIANEHFRKAALAEGLSFAAMGTAEQYEKAVNHPQAWDGRRGSQALAPFALDAMREGFDVIQNSYVPGNTVIVASRYSFAALIAKEKFGIPTITLLLNMQTLRSVYSPPRISSIPAYQHLGPGVARLVFRLVDSKYRRLFEGPLNQFRAEMGLLPVSNLYNWLHSADLLVASWPQWLYAPQTDWPSHAVCTGFIEYDGSANEGCRTSSVLQQQHPIVFTMGTAVPQMHEFFHAAVDACVTLGRPGLLVTRYREQLPEHLPSCIQHVSYAPFSELLPQASALVHNGGIGTAARALKSAIPQLILPMCHDQFENAARFTRLGVAKSGSIKHISAPAMVIALKDLLESATISERCRYWADVLRREDTLSQIRVLIERFCPNQKACFSASYPGQDGRRSRGNCL